MAGQAQPGPNQELEASSSAPPGSPEHRDIVRNAAARLYGQHLTRAQVARMLLDHLVPNGRHRPEEQRLSQARKKLRSWEQDQKFRDLIYNLAVVKLDLQAPEILGGIAKKAKRGRVDAARLALEITGRHNPKGEQQPTQVAIIVGGVPRPIHTQPAAEEYVQEAEEVLGEE